MAAPSPHKAPLAVTSRKASSMDKGSTSGVNSARMAMTSTDTRAYLSMSTGRKTPSGQSRKARLMGMAECTPKRRAS